MRAPVLRDNHWARPGISTQATKSFPRHACALAVRLATCCVLYRVPQYCARRAWLNLQKAFPTTAAPKLTLSRSCYRQHKNFNYAPSSSFYTSSTLLFMGVGSHRPPPFPSSPCLLADLLPVDESNPLSLAGNSAGGLPVLIGVRTMARL